MLALAAVRRGPQAEETLRYKQAAAELLWSASPKSDRAERSLVEKAANRVADRMLRRHGFSVVVKDRRAIFVGRSRLFTFEYTKETLVIHGAVPTFYLKQVLQSALKNLDGVRLLDNQVSVDVSHGFGIPPARDGGNCISCQS